MVDDRFSLEINCHYFLIYTCGYIHTVAFLLRPKLRSYCTIPLESDAIFAPIQYLTQVFCLNDTDTIEIPRALIPSAANDIPELVSVHALSRIDYGQRVLVEPATVEDWELIEAYSNFMEEGGLLNQVSVIYPGQELALEVNGIDQVSIRVKEISRDSTNSCGDANSSSPQYVLLIQDTEMIVEPKVRPRKKKSLWLDPFQLIPSDLEWGYSLKKLLRLSGRSSLDVNPGCVRIRSEHWPFETEWAQIRFENSNETRVVRVMTSSQIPRNKAGT